MSKDNIQKHRNTQARVQGGRCWWCDKPMQKVTAEHLVPKSEGGTDSVCNIVAACHNCNHSRPKPELWARIKKNLKKRAMA